MLSQAYSGGTNFFSKKKCPAVPKPKARRTTMNRLRNVKEKNRVQRSWMRANRMPTKCILLLIRLEWKVMQYGQNSSTLRYFLSLIYTIYLYHIILYISNQMQEEEDLVCIRHGRSDFNQGQVDFFDKNPHLKYPQAQQNQSFRSQVLFSPKFIDTRLTPEGINQCQSIKNDQSFDKVKVVLVSPLTRALQSAKIIFGHRKIPMVVHPELSQSFRYSCDLSQPIDEKIAQFPEFDFAQMKGYESHWQISRNLGLKNCESLKKVLQNHSHLSFQKQQKEICRLVGLRHFYESNQELMDRSRRMRRKLEEYRRQYTTIGVVAHLWALRYLVSSEFDRKCMPAQVLELQNARPYWFSFAKLGLKRL